MFVSDGRMLISNQAVVRALKRKKLIPFWVDENTLLPADPDNRLILVHKEPKDALSCKRLNCLDIYMERNMNYTEMAEAVREGAHARRITWKMGEKLWSDGKILIHNTPYFGESFNQAIQGYPYVCEQVDVYATDWELCAV